MNIRNNNCTNVLGDIIRSNNAEYRPLSKKEEQELIRTHHNDPDIARELLIKHNIRLVFSLARKYAPTSMDFDELIGRGLEGLCYAARKFDLKRNVKFITYATPWVFKYILKEYSDKDVNASRTGIPMDRPVKDSEGSSTTFANLIHNYIDQSVNCQNELSVTEQLDNAERYELYEDVLKYVNTDKSFDKIDREIFQRNVLEKDSIREISSDLNLQYAQTSKRRKELIGRIKDYVLCKYGVNVMEDFLGS